jgi:hypothetical protein
MKRDERQSDMSVTSGDQSLSPHRIAAVVALTLLSLAPDLPAQETMSSTPTLSPSQQPTTAISTESSTQTLNPASDSNLHSTNDIRDEVSADPRRFHYSLQLTFRGVYDDNINISQTDRVSDFYFTIEPLLTLGFGDITGREDNFLRLDYLPSLFLFADHSDNDAFQNVIRLQGQHRFSRLTLGLDEQVAILDGTDVRSLADATNPGSHANLDVGGRTKFQTYNTRLNASYDLTGKTFLSTTFDSLATNYDSASLFSSARVSEDLFINYRYSDKLVVGVGGTGGYNFVEDPNPSETFEQANVRATYQATGKISLTFSGGIEFRQFENDSRETYISPVFALSAAYQPTDATTFALSGGRHTYNSGVLAGQDFAETSVDVSVRQRFLQRFFVAVAAGYQNADYFSTVSSLSTNRNDNYLYIQPAVDVSITRFWTIGGYYLHRQNDSSLQSFSFDDNQVGLRTALVF